MSSLLSRFLLTTCTSTTVRTGKEVQVLYCTVPYPYFLHTVPVQYLFVVQVQVQVQVTCRRGFGFVGRAVAVAQAENR